MEKKVMERQQAEKLITLVCSKAHLYDASLRDHNDAHLVQNTWAFIARAMGDPKLNADDWKKKWKNLRDTYVKSKREKTTKSGQAAGKKSRWRWTEAMSFLDPFLEPKSTDSNIPDPDAGSWSSDSESEASVDMDSVTTINASDSISSASVTRSNVQSVMGTPSFIPRPAKKKRNTREGDVNDVDKAINQLLQDSHRTSNLIGQMSEPVRKTAEDLFFESCAGRMKNLPSQTKSFLQLQISELFLNAENPDLPPVPITPLPLKKKKKEL